MRLNILVIFHVFVIGYDAVSKHHDLQSFMLQKMVANQILVRASLPFPPDATLHISKINHLSEDINKPLKLRFEVTVCQKLIENIQDCNLVLSCKVVNPVTKVLQCKVLNLPIKDFIWSTHASASDLKIKSNKHQSVNSKSMKTFKDKQIESDIVGKNGNETNKIVLVDDQRRKNSIQKQEVSKTAGLPTKSYLEKIIGSKNSLNINLPTQGMNRDSTIRKDAATGDVDKLEINFSNRESKTSTNFKKNDFTVDDSNQKTAKKNDAAATDLNQNNMRKKTNKKDNPSQNSDTKPMKKTQTTATGLIQLPYFSLYLTDEFHDHIAEEALKHISLITGSPYNVETVYDVTRKNTGQGIKLEMKLTATRKLSKCIEIVCNASADLVFALQIKISAKCGPEIDFCKMFNGHVEFFDKTK